MRAIELLLISWDAEDSYPTVCGPHSEVEFNDSERNHFVSYSLGTGSVCSQHSTLQGTLTGRQQMHPVGFACRPYHQVNQRGCGSFTKSTVCMCLVWAGLGA